MHILTYKTKIKGPITPPSGAPLIPRTEEEIDWLHFTASVLSNRKVASQLTEGLQKLKDLSLWINLE